MKDMKYKEAEKEIIKETKEFAKIHNLCYDKSIEIMIVNAMREVYTLYKGKLTPPQIGEKG